MTPTRRSGTLSSGTAAGETGGAVKCGPRTAECGVSIAGWRGAGAEDVCAGAGDGQSAIGPLGVGGRRLGKSREDGTAGSGCLTADTGGLDGNDGAFSTCPFELSTGNPPLA